MSSGQASGGRPETRQAIFLATQALLTERGSQVTMQDIADRAGVSRQAVYLHFDSRADLLTQLVDWLDTERFDLPRHFAAVEKIDDAVERLDAFVDAALCYQPLVAPVARSLMDAARHGDSAAAAAFNDRMQARLDACRDVIDQLDQSGRLAANLDVTTATDLLWSLIGYPLWFDLVDSRGWTPEQAREQLTRLVHQTLTAPATGPGQRPADG